MDSEHPAPGGETPAGPAQPWHRTPVEPEGPPPWTSSRPGQEVWGAEGEPAAEPQVPVTPPGVVDRSTAGGGQGGAPPAPPASHGGVPAGPRTGGRFARAVFLYLGGVSVFSGLVALVAGNNVGAGLASAIFGVAFAVTFFVAMMLRPGAGLDPVRATLGVVSILFLVACFALAVGLADQGQTDSRNQFVRAAAAAGLFTFGMAGVGMLIPSAVAAGLAMVGLVATVELACASAGVEVFGFAVAGVLAGVAALEIAFRVPRLRAHPAAPAWMVNIAALLTGIAATALGVSFQGTAIAAAGLAGVALVLVAWRWHAVVAAVVATSPLSLVEGYLVTRAVGSSDSTSEGVIVLLAGLVVLMLVAVVGMRARGGPREVARRPVLLDELLLLAAAVFAVVALSQVGGGTPFRTSPFTPSVEQPTFPVPPTPPVFPTFPTFPPS